jgi:hypothetical protein
MKKKRYHATIERGERYWLATVDGVGMTQGRNLREVQEMAQDLVATMLDVPPGSFALRFEISLPDLVEGHLKRAAALREESKQAQSEAARELRLAARSLREQDLSLRDIGEVLGVSHQRVHQLVSAR